MRPADVPLVTVITPAYNVEKFLPLTIRSVLAQTLTDFEYLVVDNDSDDATADIIESAALLDKRVRLLRETTRGSAAARNRGLSEARGTYVAFVDGDDIWVPTKLECQVRQLQALSADYSGVFCRSVVTTEDGEDLFAYAPPTGRYDLQSFLEWFYPPGNGSSFLLRREAIQALGGFDESLDNLIDVEYVLRVLYSSPAPLIMGTPEVLVRYRKRRGSISTDVLGRMRAMETVVSRYNVQDNPLVWLRPALMAHRAGAPEEADRWSRRAQQYGWHRLVRHADGRRLLAFRTLQRVHRVLPRRCAVLSKRVLRYNSSRFGRSR